MCIDLPAFIGIVVGVAYIASGLWHPSRWP